MVVAGAALVGEGTVVVGNALAVIAELDSALDEATDGSSVGPGLHAVAAVTKIAPAMRIPFMDSTVYGHELDARR
ncbi:hypothetical protein [uncultured Mycolicibacterium sp.]|uniref:hypothetical protein n=1 Tax=uncultured Mycolicibacterium sp. TaxID=2320817 RepID=UPI0032B29836